MKKLKGRIIGQSPFQKASAQVGIPTEVQKKLKISKSEKTDIFIEFIYNEEQDIMILRKQDDIEL